MKRRRHHLRFTGLSFAVGLSACIELNKDPPDDPSATGGRANGGANPLGGSSPSGGASIARGGSITTAGAGGEAGGAPAEAGSSGAQSGGSGGGGGSSEGGADSTTGGVQGGTSAGGRSSGGTGAGGTPTQGGTTTGGTSPTAGSAGEPTAGVGGAEPDVDWNGGGPIDPGDRCSVGVLDPESPPVTLSLSGNLNAHDPAVIHNGGRYYVFHTGSRIQVKTSTNLTQWSAAGSVFSGNPAWIATKVPGVGDLWAPDISYFNGKYHLYYSASTFGSNRSCIGHATRASLGSGSWSDQGPVICSNTESGVSDDWNAIDPNLIVDTEGVPWLAFGSFWTGLKMIRLDQNGARADTALHAIAERTTGGRAIEAPFITRRCGYYYLFASFDYCCRGSSSTYHIMVGRSADVLGPYVDRTVSSMLDGAGSLVLQGGSRWRGPGHNALLFVGDAAYNVYHSYDANNGGQPTLRISELRWNDEGWPVSAGP